ncbi:hypothetical protein ACMA1D_11755 [Streptomyces sp. 796.1]|uniref:hypothetical protein n=1 Tax=Streptomyces sp. 796.1 TaxID=3163029 RepID=UPI0039C8D2E8
MSMDGNSTLHRDNHDTEAPAGSPAPQGDEGNDNSIDDLPDDVSPAPATGFRLDNAHEETAAW